ncbi:ParA family protein [Tepidibacillus marianensis]|uniref:ParA family protein n=1 Tax=Tepidibacillus marianensis TaxID=3131995 RepID=UPI0030D6114A
MEKTIAMIKMKGGVGKTTLTVQLAWHMMNRNLRVLVVDLDPQSNASHYLTGPSVTKNILMLINPLPYIFLKGFLY